MPEGDELAINIAGNPEGVSIFEVGTTWVTCRNGDQVYWVACKFKGVRAGETYKVITRMLRDRDGFVLRLEADLACTEDADEYATYILESRLGYWRTK